MSELKTRFIDDTYVEYYNTGNHELAQIYLKSEADKVIADKDAKILALDAEVFKQKHHAELFLDERNYAEARLRHHKYKRCLAMAKLCQWKMGVFIYKKEKNEFYYRWHKRWLAIAEQFKGAK